VNGQAAAEAAAWLARLQSDERKPEDEAAFRAWLAESESNREAFDRVTSAWELAGGLAAHYPLDTVVAPPRPARRQLAIVAMLLVVATVAGMGGLTYLNRADVYSTAAGETRRVALADGSIVLLDSSSELRVKLRKARRDLSLEHGRAHFEVAKNPDRPFLVTAGSRQVRSIGTVFEVSQREGKTSVLLVEGRVAVRSLGPRAAQPESFMAPGDRLVFDRAGVQRDRPDVAKLIAWRSGEAIFDDDSLAAAAAELNRYSRRPLVIADATAASMRVSGVFRAGATEEFATSVATLLPIAVEAQDDRILIRSRSASD
jgi:transmembrane sensor